MVLCITRRWVSSAVAILFNVGRIPNVVAIVFMTKVWSLAVVLLHVATITLSARACFWNLPCALRFLSWIVKQLPLLCVLFEAFIA